MRIDIYTKVVLTAIALFLGVIALRPYVSPDAVHAQGAFAGVQWGGAGSFFDGRTGEIWEYADDGNGNLNLYRKYRLTKLGQPMVKEK